MFTLSGSIGTIHYAHWTTALPAHSMHRSQRPRQRSLAAGQRSGTGQDEGTVILRELVLVNFRNYVRLALTPGDPITVLVGDNGQGKSNVLEAIYLLATTRSPRTGNDRELVHWRARRDVIPFARWRPASIATTPRSTSRS